MFRLIFRTATALCLIGGFLLWKSGLSGASLPTGAAGWVAAYFDLFRDPVASAALLAVCLLLCLFGIYSDSQKARQFQHEFPPRGEKAG